VDRAEIASWSWYKGNLVWLPKRTIFLTRSGSHSYGTNIASSDEDFKGIAIAPMSYYLGNLNHFEQADKAYGVEGLDLTIFDIKKFFDLATKCNPSVIEILFTDESDWIIPKDQAAAYLGDSSAFADIHWNRKLFLSTKARHTFSGYAMSQLDRIQTHRRWLLNPPKKKPERADYDLPKTSTIEKEQMGVINSRIRKHEDKLGGVGFTVDKVRDVDESLIEKVTEELNIPRDLIRVIHNERRYNNSMKEWSQYETWKKERNEKRAELEAKYGYDTKHAMHLVRLMRMAQEIVSTGEVHVKRPDAQELLSIRAGAWSFDRLMEWAHSIDGSLEIAEKVSPLPHDPNREKIDELLVRTIEEFTP
jgi:uncharacterized protein